MIGVRLAEDLVNLAADGAGSFAPDELGSLLRGSFVHGADVDALDAHAVLLLEEWAARLREVFASASVAERTERLNGILTDGVRSVLLATHDDLPPHLHFADAEDDLVQRVRALTSGGLAIFAVEARAERMGVCDRPGCGRVFVDTSKNGRRAYCTAACGNAEAVRRYRGRVQGEGG